MTTEAWHPDEHDQQQAEESYIRYLAGVAILANPQSTRPLHNRQPGSHEDTIPIIGHAETLMYDGIKGVIRLAHPPEDRSLLIDLEHKFARAYPHMQATVKRVCDLGAERIAPLNTMFAIIRPAPFLEETTYDFICHSRREKLRTSKLIEPFEPAAVFRTALAERTLQAQSRTSGLHAV